MADTGAVYISTSANYMEEVYLAPNYNFGHHYEEPDPVIWVCEACGTSHNITGMEALVCRQCGHPLSEVYEEDEVLWDDVEDEEEPQKKKWWQFWKSED
jgi:hypothetical protein